MHYSRKGGGVPTTQSLVLCGLCVKAAGRGQSLQVPSHLQAPWQPHVSSGHGGHRGNPCRGGQPAWLLPACSAPQTLPLPQPPLLRVPSLPPHWRCSTRVYLLATGPPVPRSLHVAEPGHRRPHPARPAPPRQTGPQLALWAGEARVRAPSPHRSCPK